MPYSIKVNEPIWTKPVAKLAIILPKPVSIFMPKPTLKKFASLLSIVSTMLVINKPMLLEALTMSASVNLYCLMFANDLVNIYVAVPATTIAAAPEPIITESTGPPIS